MNDIDVVLLFHFAITPYIMITLSDGHTIVNEKPDMENLQDFYSTLNLQKKGTFYTPDPSTAAHGH